MDDGRSARCVSPPAREGRAPSRPPPTPATLKVRFEQNTFGHWLGRTNALGILQRNDLLERLRSAVAEGDFLLVARLEV